MRCVVLSELLLKTDDAASLVERFSSEVQIAEARCFYGFQIMMCVASFEIKGVY